MRKRGGLEKLAIFAVLICLIIPLLSAGAFSDFINKIFFSPGPQPTNVTISVTGSNPAQIIYVQPILSTAPLEETYRNINFTLTMRDIDGLSDINISSVKANLTHLGETTRGNSSCIIKTFENTSNTANFTCTVSMWYWDGNYPDWVVNVSGTDKGAQTRVYNDTTRFAYQEFKALVVTPSVLTWPPVSSGAANQRSNNDPTWINNTGNFQGNVKVKGIDLYGVEIDPLIFIPAANFIVDNDTDDPTCVVGNFLINNSDVTIVASSSNRGNLSQGGEAGQEKLYYCLDVPSISTQTYSTTKGGSWIISY